MEEKFGRALQSGPREFLVLVEKHQSRPDKFALKTALWSWSLHASASSKSKLCDALSLATSQAVFAFENLSDDNETPKTPSPPKKKRRKRSSRNHNSEAEEEDEEEDDTAGRNRRRRLGLLNALRGYAHLAQLCVTHPEKEKGFFPPWDVFPVVQTLHEKLVLFEEDVALQDCVSGMCELWWRESWAGRESLIAQSLPCLLSKSLSAGRKIDVHRVYAMREAFTFFDFTDEESIHDLKHLLIRCVVTPLYVRTEEGRRFISFLLGLNAQLANDVLAIIRSQIPFGRASILEAYGQILYKAWRVAKDSSLHEIHNSCMQGLVEGAIYASSKTLASSIRKLLQGFINQRTQEGVEALLFRLQEPILFRALQACIKQILTRF
ncbi:hypothetical protein KI387_023244 [Taxus chinensis]|uniref:Uncharacterized protein n=1 Tax=Taxus chinensis TaxID=29808 RepID=A0AA38LBL7_TAXCH|nr:hypothetical protein KI387_023244 [Taxus chinensis]